MSTEKGSVVSAKLSIPPEMEEAWKKFCEQNKEGMEVTAQEKQSKQQNETASSYHELHKELYEKMVEELREAAANKELQEKMLWKLFKGKFLFQFYLCTPCQNKLFTNQDRVLRSAEKEFIIKFTMCEDCAKTNVKATDLLAPPKNGWKRKEVLVSKNEDEPEQKKESKE